MEKVTYILGAGFSAPLGLPVMQDFLAKSKDLYFSDPRRYRHFERVFDLVRNLLLKITLMLIYSILRKYYQYLRCRYLSTNGPLVDIF